MKKTEIAKMFADYALLLANQAKGYKKVDLIDFLEGVSKSHEEDVPDIVLGKDLNHLYFRYRGSNSNRELITTDNLRVYMERFEESRSGRKQDRKKEVLNGRLIYSKGDRLFVRIPWNDGRIKTFTRKENDYGRELYCDKRLTVYSCTGRMTFELQQILLSVGKR